MKNLFLKFALLVASISINLLFAQNQMTGLDHKDQYFIPDGVLCDDDSCCTQFEGESPLNALGNVLEYTLFAGNTHFNYYTNVYDIAQPYQTTEPINIIGVSFWSSVTFYGERNAYICITDDTLGILHRAKINNYPDTTQEPVYDLQHYTELFFDTAITIDGLFYIMFDNPKAYPFDEDLYNWHQETTTLDRQISYEMRLCYIKNCPEYTQSSLWRKYHVLPYGVGDTDSTEIATDWSPVAIAAAGWYMFPIIGELDTTTTDTSSLAKVDIGKFTYTYPNPTSDNVTVQCSFRMKNIEVYNSLGQKVEESTVDGYNKSINTEKYPKGNYILKIITESGTVDKKLVVQ